LSFRRKTKKSDATSAVDVIPNVTFQAPPVGNPVTLDTGIHSSPEPVKRKLDTPPVALNTSACERPKLTTPPGDLSPWSVVE